MLTTKEIKKSEIVYQCFNDVVFVNSNTSVALCNIISFKESNLEVEIETYFPADELKRGWVGDMYYETARGMSVATCERVDNTYKKCIKDVLLARVNSYKDDDCVIFTYTFLKY